MCSYFSAITEIVNQIHMYVSKNRAVSMILILSLYVKSVRQMCQSLPLNDVKKTGKYAEND